MRESLTGHNKNMDAVEVVVNDSESQEELVVCRVCLGHEHAMRGLFHEEEGHGDVGVVGSAAEKAMSLASVKVRMQVVICFEGFQRVEQ